jgi:hypothetical protein
MKVIGVMDYFGTRRFAGEADLPKEVLAILEKRNGLNDGRSVWMAAREPLLVITPLERT